MFSKADVIFDVCRSRLWFRIEPGGVGVALARYDHVVITCGPLPRTHSAVIALFLVLMLLMRGHAHLIDVNCAFLLGHWERDIVTNRKRRGLWSRLKAGWVASIRWSRRLESRETRWFR